MGYVTRFTSHAQRDLLKIPRPDAVRILHRLAELQKALTAGDTAAFDVKVLRGHATRRRLHVGDHRVVHTVEDDQLIVRVLAAGHRREVYRGH
ncbi:type II toxin-antitoxin system RelE/ParE family toxin [Streptomyces erythrochromogenes]|uniref:type II toxin-antitoxin system RelE family toxin n=1 Tax=Streptomyces erythrochromogenes TaxID=285574 RepID=UPI0034294102